MKNSLGPTVEKHLVWELIKDISVTRITNDIISDGRISFSPTHEKPRDIIFQSRKSGVSRMKQQISAGNMSLSFFSRTMRGIATIFCVAS